MDYSLYYIAIPIIVVIAVVGWLIWRRTRIKIEDETGVSKVVPMLEPGWQFFPSPTNGDAPGTIFRINTDKVRHEVTEVKAPVHENNTVEGKKTRQTEADTSMLLKVLGINLNASVGGSHKEQVVFEMGDSLKQVTVDKEIDDLVSKEMVGVTLRPDSRYYIIRETTATKQIDFEIKRDLVERLGGEAKIKDNVEANATVFEKKDAATYELKRTFGEPMRVMFCAEELFVKDGGVAFRGPPQREITHRPVTERLEFTDAA